MTIAVCFSCGSLKGEPLGSCDRCSSIPKEEDEVVSSMLMTDENFDLATLHRIAKTISNGGTLRVNETMRIEMREKIREVEYLNKIRQFSENEM